VGVGELAAVAVAKGLALPEEDPETLIEGVEL
jgi:hypothetical protein